MTRIYLPLPVDYDEDDELSGLHTHGLEGAAALALAVGMLCYCKRRLTDGRVPAEQPARILPDLSPDQLQALLKHLLSTCFITGEAGAWQVVGYTDRYGSREEAERRAATKRTAGAQGGRSRRKGAGRSRTEAGASRLLGGGQAPLRARRDRDIVIENPPQAPLSDDANADNGARGGGDGRTDLVTQVQALMASQGHPVSHEEAEVITWQLLGERDDIAHPAAYLRAAISTAERAAALVGADGQHRPPPRSRTPSTYRPVTDLDRRIIDAFEDRLGATISAGQAAAVRESLAERGITDPGAVLSVIETDRDPRALLAPRKHVPGQNVAAALAAGGVRIPATEEQRTKHADDAREQLAAAARARLENEPDQDEHHDYQDRDLDGLDHDPEPEREPEPEPADAEPPY
jgi:hypothetical protein